MRQSAAVLASLFVVAGAPLHGQQADGSTTATAPDGKAIVVTRSEEQSSRQGSAENFTGAVRVDQYFQASAPGRVSGARVTFEPGARTAWHSHPLGQTLIVTSGVGRVQRWGAAVDEIRAGDVVWIAPGQKHWHGASPTTSMSHIAIAERLDGKSVDWMEKVSDEQYGAAVRPRPAVGPSGDAAPADRPTRAQRLMGDFAPKLAELTGLLASESAAEGAAKSNPEAALSLAKPETVRLWPGVAPGSEEWKQPEATLRPGTICNVSTPTLTLYRPVPSTATGTAVIIAPGGGFIGLSIDSEGHDVAKWLAARGITGIVLKYRTVPLEGQDAAQLGQAAGARFGAQLRNYALIDEDGKYGIADGIQAVKVVRAHAAEWGLSPDRIVFTGFSAGGMVTVFTALQPDARPDYVAPIYGAPISAVPPIPPQGLPPFFMAMAQDDILAGPMIVRLYEAIKSAGYKPEFHIYSSGGHGWGMRKQGKTSDHWIEELYWWLEAQGLTRTAN